MSTEAAAPAPATTQPGTEAKPQTTEAAAPAATTTEANKLAAPTPTATETAASLDGKAPPASETKVAPEKYDLKLSSTSSLNQTALARIEALARANGLSQEDAQSLVTKQEAEVKTYVDERKNAWREEALADKEIGGEKLNENVEIAKRTFERVAPPGLKEELEKTGFGNHPMVVKMMLRIGKELGITGDKLVQPGNGSATEKSAAQLLYGVNGVNT